MSGRAFGDAIADLVGVVPRAEMGSDHQLVAELPAALQQIVEVHVAELVDLVLAMRGETNVSSMMSTSASNMAGQASSPAGELSPR